MTLRVIAWPKSKNAATNPFQALLYRAVEIQAGVEVEEFRPSQMILPGQRLLHIHWPDVFLATARGWRFWAKLAFLRMLCAVAFVRGVPVVWTAHNIKRSGQRNSDRLDRFFWPWFSHRVDAIIFMTSASKLKAEAQFPNWKSIPTAVIPHGHYRPVIDAARNLTTVSRPPCSAGNLLFFGSITRYKNAFKLLQAFLGLPADTAHLSILGKMSGASPDEKLLDLLANLPPERLAEVVYEDRFLEDAELVAAIRDTDLVVFPYSDVLNSGAAIFALSVGRPILASDNALFRELQGQVGPDWVRLIEGDLDAAQLSAALEQARALNASGAAPDLSAFEWDRIAAQTVEFYDTVISGRRRR